MTYCLQPKPDESMKLMGGSECAPVATLKDEYGGVSHIIIDDHCYVLANGEDSQGRCGMVKHWFTEAIVALQGLPADPRDLEPAICCAGRQPEDQQFEPPTQRGGPLT